MKQALVLSGGAIRGAFQAGAVLEVLRSGFVPDAIYGVSVGGLNGAFLADRAGRAALRGETPDWPRIAEELERLWMHKIISPSVVGKTRTGLALAHSVVSNDFRGLIDPASLYNFVRREIKEENLRNSPVKLRVGVVDIATGDYCNVGTEVPNLVDHIIASASIPILMPIPMVSGRPLADGGLRHVIPVKAALDEGAEEIVCVLCQTRNVSWAQSDCKNLAGLLNRLMDILTHELVDRDLEQAQCIISRGRQGNGAAEGHRCNGSSSPSITIIRPLTDAPIALCDFTMKHIQNMVREGRHIARDVLSARGYGPAVPDGHPPSIVAASEAISHQEDRQQAVVV